MIDTSKHDLQYGCIREDCGGTCMGCNIPTCTVCGAYEGGLATECPGARTTTEQDDAVYAGKIDFVGGKWITKE